MFDNEFPPLGGGTGVVNYHLLRELAGYPEIHVDLVTSSRSRSTFETEQFARQIRVFKVPVHNTNIHHARNVELIRYSWRGLQQGRRLSAERHYDLSFAFAGVPAGAISLAMARTSGLPYIVSLQGPDIPGFERRYAPLYPFLKPLIRRVWRNAESVIASSSDNRRLAYKFIPGIEYTLIHNGVDTQAFKPAEPSVPSPHVRILCVGRLIERKGQAHLLHAAAQLRRALGDVFRVNIVGTGDGEQRLKEECHALGLDDIVTFSVVVGREEMPPVYREADIFVLPSQSEGMSLALLEAMASGLPVVVTPAGGSEELVREGKNGFIVPWADREGLAAALRPLIAETGLRKTMGTESLRRARELSWAAITQQHLRLFEAVLQKKTKHRIT